MSLLNRVSLYFIGTLALVLAVYSAVLFGTMRHQLHEQFDEQLNGAFRTLVAAIEVEPDDVKFEPSDHTVALGSDARAEEIRWLVFDEQGLVVDRSRNLRTAGPAESPLLDYATSLKATGEDSVDVGRYRVLQRRLAAVAPKPASERDPLERESLVVTVAKSPDDLNASLRSLSMLVIVVPLIVLLAAGVVVRGLCRRALAPVGEMAARARTMAASDAYRRLPVAATRDELAELGEAFNGVLDRLFETLERQRRFAGDAAHQLRTPLTAVIGQLDVALRRTRSPEEYRETLGVVREEADQLHRLVESLLFLARAESDAPLPDSGQVELGSWLRDYLGAWGAHPRAAEITSEVDDPARVFTSRVLLKQLLDNLVNNALKYSEPGTPIRIRLRKMGDECELSVADRGIGIARDDMSSIFQPFFRSAEARRSGVAGTGLGLAVAMRIATALGGTLTCESEPGKGTTITLRLPTTR